jgi:hypothetical protein
LLVIEGIIMEIDKEQIDELKNILEPHQFFEAGTELPTQHFLDMDVLALGVFYKGLINMEGKNGK